MDAGAVQSYKRALLKNDEMLFHGFKKQGVRFAKIYTDEDAGLKLARAMAYANRRR